jgi:ankyrin repeat protein
MYNSHLNNNETIHNYSFKDVSMALSEPKLFEEIIQSGFDVNAKDEHGRPLILCSLYHPEAMKILIKKGANINFTTFGKIFLYFALSKPEALNLLIEEGGADINAMNTCNENLLTEAIRGHEIPSAILLISKGATLQTNILFESEFEKFGNELIDYIDKKMKNAEDAIVEQDLSYELYLYNEIKKYLNSKHFEAPKVSIDTRETSFHFEDVDTGNENSLLHEYEFSNIDNFIKCAGEGFFSSSMAFAL